MLYWICAWLTMAESRFYLEMKRLVKPLYPKVCFSLKLAFLGNISTFALGGKWVLRSMGRRIAYVASLPVTMIWPSFNVAHTIYSIISRLSEVVTYNIWPLLALYSPYGIAFD